ncbi:MAG: hypothetical protein IPP96_00980 [Chitinophagaceae bacterium]|nr:hypothetical protein [Chitinophagaceae bacterium]
MYKQKYSLLFLLVLSGILFLSCQKEIDGSLAPGFTPPTPTNLKPRLGTTWTYRYYIYHQDGSLYQARIMTLKAKTEDTIAGEKWLNVVDVDKDTTVWLLQSKTDGLYQYANNASNLFCKEPAVIGDNYTTFNEGAAENFIVRGVKDTLPTGIGDIPTNYYEGYKSTILIDLVWYNNNAWIVRKLQYRNRSRLTPFWYKYSTLYLDQIIY